MTTFFSHPLYISSSVKGNFRTMAGGLPASSPLPALLTRGTCGEGAWGGAWGFLGAWLYRVSASAPAPRLSDESDAAKEFLAAKDVPAACPSGRSLGRSRGPRPPPPAAASPSSAWKPPLCGVFVCPLVCARPSEDGAAEAEPECGLSEDESVELGFASPRVDGRRFGCVDRAAASPRENPCAKPVRAYRS